MARSMFLISLCVTERKGIRNGCFGGCFKNFEPLKQLVVSSKCLFALWGRNVLYQVSVEPSRQQPLKVLYLCSLGVLLLKEGRLEMLCCHSESSSFGLVWQKNNKKKQKQQKKEVCLDTVRNMCSHWPAHVIIFCIFLTNKSVLHKTTVSARVFFENGRTWKRQVDQDKRRREQNGN